MSRERIPILNVAVDSVTQSELLESFTEGFMVTPNVDHLMTLQEDREFYDIYQQADVVTVDSQILYLVMKYMLRLPIQAKVSGSDFFPAFCEHHLTDEEVRIFLLGGKEGAEQKVRDAINQKAGRDCVVGAYSPPFGFENNAEECDRIVEQIHASGATVLAVGVGAPKQEKWMAAHRHRLPEVRMFLGVGVTIEFMAGTVKRSPPWVSRLGLEWLHRLVQDPVRLTRRYLVRDLPFFRLAWQQAVGRYVNPFEEDGER